MPDGTLLYWDYMERRIGKIDPQGKPSTFLSNTDGQSAMGFDSKGRLVTTLKEHPPENKVGVIWPKGSEAILADKFEGKDFEGPNDLVVDKKDGVYFTLSGSGTVLYARPAQRWSRCSRTRPSGSTALSLSPDEKTLYVAPQSRVAKTTLSIADLPKEGGEYLWAFDVQPDGTLTNHRNFAKYPDRDPAAERHARSQVWRGRPHDRCAGPRVCRNGGGYSGLQPTGPAPGHDSGVTESQQPGVCGSRQEDPVHRRPRRRLQGPDARRRVQGTGEVDRSTVSVCSLRPPGSGLRSAANSTRSRTGDRRP